jgi:uncharacterized protein
VNELKLPSLSEMPVVPPGALDVLPIFPLPGTLLLPQTIISLHVFEPRYRHMMEDVINGHRTFAVAMLDEGGEPDRYGRPPVHPVAGVGVLRRSARLPDGRYNVLVEGVIRADIKDELEPVSAVPYRRVRARPLSDVVSAPEEEIESAANALRALCSRVVSALGSADAEIMERLNEISEPATLADMIAAAAVQDLEDRQRILAELDVLKRIELASGALGALLIKSSTGSNKAARGWGPGSGEA